MDDANVTQYEHVPVLLQETLRGLNIRSDGMYVDCTLGCGGHSAAILERLGDKGRLLAFDRDPDVVKGADRRLFDDPRFTFVRGSFTGLEEIVDGLNLRGKVDGVLLDLGISSPQLCNASRGFSFMRDGDLDMRMDNSSGLTAADWLNRASKKEIADVLYQFGDERFSRRIASAIVRKRRDKAITHTLDLADLIAAVIPNKRGRLHPATRTFQAIRIFINRELEELEAVLAQVLRILVGHGRLLVISFHSLEHRIVKRFMRVESRGPDVPREILLRHQEFQPRLSVIGGPIHCQPDEVRKNTRARSAVLRIAECLPR